MMITLGKLPGVFCYFIKETALAYGEKVVRNEPFLLFTQKKKDAAAAASRMELLTGVGPVTSSLPRMRSTY